MDKFDHDDRREAFDLEAQLVSSRRTDVRPVTVKDREEIMDWFQGHGHEHTGLPRVGFRTKTVACFVNTAECDMAFIDHLVKRPGSSNNDDEGFRVVAACIEWAKKSRISYLFAVSAYPHILKYSEALGFEKQPHKYITMRF